MNTRKNEPEPRIGTLRVFIHIVCAVGMAAFCFTLGFFIGRASGGTAVNVYVENPEGMYVPASTIMSVTGTSETETVTSAVTSATTTITAATSASSATTTSAASTAASETTAATSAEKTTATSEVATTTETTTVTTTVSNGTDAAGRVNLNTATLAQLDTLPGIGETLAQRIIDYRNTHGAFRTVDEIINVSGIGEKKLAELRPYATVG